MALLPACSAPTEDSDALVEFAVQEQAIGYGPPIAISTLSQLRNMNPSRNYVLTADINASATHQPGNAFVPIGNGRVPFYGNFDGNGHTISNLRIVSQGGNTGIFGTTFDSHISDVGLVNVTVVGQTNTGALVGSGSDTIISDCYVEGTVTAAGGGPWARVGLLAGSLSGESKIERSYAVGTVSGNVRDVGGVIGVLDGEYGVAAGIHEVFADVGVYPSFGLGSYPVSAGGVAGVITATTVADVHSRGEVIGDYSGGVIGTVQLSNLPGRYSNFYSVMTHAVVTVHNVPGRTGAVGRWEDDFGTCRSVLHNTTTDGGSLPGGLTPSCVQGHTRFELQNPGPDFYPFTFGPTDGDWDFTVWNLNGPNQYPTLRTIPNANTVQPLQDPGQ